MVDGIEYRVTRYKGYTKMKNALILEEDGEEPENDDKISTQKRIEEILGYSYDLFKNSIIFGQKLKRLISETGPNKKKVFDDAFEVTYIPKAKKIAELKLIDHKEEFRKKELAWEKLQGKINGKESAIESEETLVAGFEDRIAEKLDIIRIKIKKQKKAHNQLLLQHVDLDQSLYEHNHELEIFEKDLVPDNEMLDMERDLVKKEGKRDRADEDADAVEKEMEKLQKLIDNVPKKCPNCSKPYTKGERAGYLGSLAGQMIKKKLLHQKFIDSVGILKGQITELEGSISSALKCSESYTTTKKQFLSLIKILSEHNAHHHRTFAYHL